MKRKAEKISDTERINWLIVREGMIERGGVDHNSPREFFRVHWMPESVPTAWFDTGRLAIDAAIIASRRRAK